MTVKFLLRRYLLDPRFVVRYAILKQRPKYLTRKNAGNLLKQQQQEAEQRQDRETKLTSVWMTTGADWIFKIEDVMTRLYRLHSPKRPLTGKELYLRFITPIVRSFQEQPHLWVYIVVFDKPWFMTKPKLRHLEEEEDDDDDEKEKGEQKEKKKKKKTTKSTSSPPPIVYPDDAKIVDAGVEWITDGGGKPRQEMIQISAVMNNKALRPRLYDYLLEKMKADEHLKPYRILVDVLFEGPVAFAGGTFRLATELRNETGEADLAVWAYALRCRAPNNHLHIVCCDRDLVLLGLLLFMEHFFGRVGSLLIDVYGKYADTVEILNLPYLVPAMIEAGYSVEALVVGVILCGTDYVERTVLFEQCNPEFLVDFTHRWLDDHPDNFRAFVKEQSVDAFVRFVRAVYDNMPTHIASRARAHKPSVAVMREQARVVFDNLTYWQTLDNLLLPGGGGISKRQREEDNEMVEPKKRKKKTMGGVTDAQTTQKPPSAAAPNGTVLAESKADQS